MNFLLIIFINCYGKDKKEDVYILPKDVIEARDGAVNALNHFHYSLIVRFIELKRKTNRTLKEEREFIALDAIIYDKKIEMTPYVKEKIDYNLKD